MVIEGTIRVYVSSDLGFRASISSLLFKRKIDGFYDCKAAYIPYAVDHWEK